MMSGGILVLVFFVVMGYISIGVYVFRALEADFEISRQEELLGKLDRFLEKYPCVSRRTLQNLLDSFDRDLDLARYVLTHNQTRNVMWNGPGAASFVFSVITTIGYGHITPRTPMGKVVCMVYAIIGIPLLLVFLTGIGEWLCKMSDRCLQSRHLCSCCRTYPRLSAILQGAVGLTIIFAVPTAANVKIEGWTVLEAVYYWFITLTTIGFGDLVAANPLTRETYDRSADKVLFRLACNVWTLIGLGFLSMIITSITRCYVRSTGCVRQKAQQKMKKVVERVNRKLTCCRCTTSTQIQPMQETTSTQPLTVTQDVDLADTLAFDNDIRLLRFSAIPDVLARSPQPRDAGDGSAPSVKPAAPVGNDRNRTAEEVENLAYSWPRRSSPLPPASAVIKSSSVRTRQTHPNHDDIREDRISRRFPKGTPSANGHAATECYKKHSPGDSSNTSAGDNNGTAASMLLNTSQFVESVVVETVSRKTF